MIYDEQQINNCLKNIELQQEYNQIRWQVPKKINPFFNNSKNKQPDITEWITDKQRHQTYTKRNANLVLNDKKKIKGKRSARFLQILNELEQNQSIPKEKILHYRSEDKAIAPKKVNIKLLMPRGFSQTYKSTVTQKKTSLPFLKKNSKIKNQEKKQHKGDLFISFKQNQSEFIEKIFQNNAKQSYRKGRMMGNTRRQNKNFYSCIQKTTRSSFDYSQLKECITFIK